MANDRRFAELVSVACHDILTPLATVYGFARTLEQLPLEAPAPRYLEMIGAASAQIDDLVDQLRLVARIESGKYDPTLVERDSLELAQAAAERLEEGRLNVAGRGAPVLVDPEPAARALSQLARAAARFGGHESVSLDVDGPELDDLAALAQREAGRARRGGQGARSARSRAPDRSARRRARGPRGLARGPPG